MDIPITTENIPGTIPLRDANGNISLGSLVGVATDIADNVVSASKILGGSISDVHISPSANIALGKLASGVLPSGITVASANIPAGTVSDAQINAGISPSKLASGVLPSGVSVSSANIASGTIVDGDINPSANIALTKLAAGILPSGITVSSANVSGKIAVSSLTNGNARQLLQTNAAGNGVEWTNNVEVPGTLAANGATSLNGTLNVSGATTLGTLNAGTTELSSATVTGALDAGSTTLAGVTVTGAATLNNDLAHKGTKVGFFNTAPVTKPAAVAAPALGTTIDTEARTAINAIINRLQTLGLIA